MVFVFVQATILDIFGPLNSAKKGCMTLFPAILALRYSRVHIGTSNHSNVASYIEASVDEFFGITTTLDIPYIKLDDGYVRFERDLNYIRS